MYTEYFGLTDYPFRITPDTDYLYMSPVHSRALAYMEYAIVNREGFVVIAGEIGSGKTTLIKQLISDLDDNVLVAKIFQTQLDEVEILQSILAEFGLNPFNAKKVELLNMLNQFLVDRYLEGKQILLLIDDAQNLSKKALSEITMLSGIETQKEKILHVILVGQPEFNYMLDDPEMEQLLQRVSLRYHVRALTNKETKEYIIHRLKVAGLNNQLFTDKTYQIIYDYSGGIPRLINTLCDTALTCAYADNKDYVDNDELDSAINELHWKKYSEMHVSSDESSFYNRDNLYERRKTHIINTTDKQGIVNNASHIATRALVEVTRQLKRIADHLDNK